MGDVVMVPRWLVPGMAAIIITFGPTLVLAFMLLLVGALA